MENPRAKPGDFLCAVKFFIGPSRKKAPSNSAQKKFFGVRAGLNTTALHVEFIQDLKRTDT